mmetsp:Transcript_23362/g.41906  ORF Transcript_23362/g.41906 Transcript_23362/m.41906 type:complete len:202 (+) Transcript_23362:355-960(+)
MTVNSRTQHTITPNLMRHHNKFLPPIHHRQRSRHNNLPRHGLHFIHQNRIRIQLANRHVYRSLLHGLQSRYRGIRRLKSRHFHATRLAVGKLQVARHGTRRIHRVQIVSNPPGQPQIGDGTQRGIDVATVAHPIVAADATEDGEDGGRGGGGGGRASGGGRFAGRGSHLGRRCAEASGDDATAICDDGGSSSSLLLLLLLR